MMTAREWHAALMPLTEQLRRIADALEWTIAQQEPTPEPESTGLCPHPMDSRIGLGLTATGESEWICGLCQHRHP